MAAFLKIMVAIQVSGYCPVPVPSTWGLGLGMSRVPEPCQNREMYQAYMGVLMAGFDLGGLHFFRIL